MNRSELEYIAAALIDGGWTPADSEQLAHECELAPDEVEAIVDVMREMLARELWAK